MLSHAGADSSNGDPPFGANSNETTAARTRPTPQPTAGATTVAVTSRERSRAMVRLAIRPPEEPEEPRAGRSAEDRHSLRTHSVPRIRLANWRRVGTEAREQACQ